MTKSRPSFPCIEEPRFTLSQSHNLTVNDKLVVSLSKTTTDWRVDAQGRLMYQSHYCILDMDHGPLKLSKEPTKSEFYVESTESGVYIVCNRNETPLFLHSIQDSLLVGLVRDSKTVWKMHTTTGELCLLQNGACRLRCEPGGKVSASTKPVFGWDVWRIQDSAGDTVLISSWTDRCYLISSPEGVVSTSRSADFDAYWKIEKHFKRGLWIRSMAHNRLLQLSKSSLATTAVLDDSSESLLTFKAANGDFFWLSQQSKQLACQPVLNRLFLSDKKDDWGRWKVNFVQADRVTLQYGDQFLAKKGSRVVAQKAAMEWKVEETDVEGPCYFLDSNNQYLSITSSNDIVCQSDPPLTPWMLTPRVPDTLTGKQRKFQTIGIVSAAVGAFVLPEVAVGLAGVVAIKRLLDSGSTRRTTEVSLCHDEEPVVTKQDSDYAGWMTWPVTED